MTDFWSPNDGFSGSLATGVLDGLAAGLVMEAFSHRVGTFSHWATTQARMFVYFSRQRSLN